MKYGKRKFRSGRCFFFIKKEEKKALQYVKFGRRGTWSHFKTWYRKTFFWLWCRECNKRTRQTISKKEIVIFLYMSLRSLNRPNTRSSRPEVFCKKVLLEISQNSQEKACTRVSFLIKLQASSKNTLSYRTPPVAASVNLWQSIITSWNLKNSTTKLRIMIRH